MNEGGSRNVFYYIGQLSEKIWVGLRVSTALHPRAPITREIYEAYCQYAGLAAAKAKLAKNERAPKFCIGLESAPNIPAGILTEDFSKGGALRLVGEAGEEYSIIEKTGERVYHDFPDNSDIVSKIEFMKTENMIALWKLR